MITWATLVAGLAIWGLGRALVGLLADGRSRLEVHSLSLLVGLAVWAALISCVGLFGSLAAWSRASGFVVAGLVTLVGLVVAWRARGASVVRERTPWTFVELLGAGLAAAFALFAVFYAASMPIHIFDPVFHFAYKGKLLYYEGLMGPGWTDVEGPIGRVITHPDYPPGVGALEALVSWLSGTFDADATRPLFALFALGMGGLLFARLAESSRRAAVTGCLMWQALPFLFYSRLPHQSWLKGSYGLFFGPDAGEARFGRTLGPAGPIPGEWSMPDGWTLDGAGDLPLAALFSAGALLLFAALTGSSRERRRGDLVLAGLLLGGGALMKNEGLALLPVALLAAALSWLFSRHAAKLSLGAAARALATTLGLALVVAGPWLLVRGSAPTIGEDYPSRLSPSGFLEAAGGTQLVRLSMESDTPERRPVPRIVADGFLEAFANVPRFGALWLLFFGVLAFTLVRRRQRLAGTPLAASLAVLGASVLYALVLVVTPWNLDALFKTAIPDRLVFHVAPLAIFALVMLLEEPAGSETKSAADQPS